MDPPPPPASSTPANSTAADVHTYHCLCSHLLLASTLPLDALPRRSAGSLDKAYILPLPPPPRASESDSDSPSDSEADLDIDSSVDNAVASGPSSANTDAPGARRGKSRARSGKEGSAGGDYALLLSTVLDRRPQLVTRSDGFEKRWLQRCGRCRVVVGYQLDKAQYASESGEGGMGRRENVVYLLPGGLVGTEDMVNGEKPPDGGLGLGEDG